MSNLWIVKDSLDQVQGPFETKEILFQIKNGVFSGDEFIAAYPEGVWKKISTEPEFFDYMLAVISGDTSSIEEKTNLEPEATEYINSTQQIDLPKDGIEDLLSDAEPIVPEDFESVGFSDESDSEQTALSVSPIIESPKQHREAKGRSHLFEDRQALNIDRLDSLRIKTEKAQKSKKVLYLLAVAALGLILSLLFVDDSKVEVKKDGLRFTLPERSKAPAIKPEFKNKAILKAASLLQTDLFSNVVQAQNILNSVLKYEPRNKESVLFLCSSYLRLWDYTAKSGKDLYVVSEIAKRAYGIGSGGDVLYVCRLTEMILRGKNAEATIAVDSYLNAEGLSSEKSFYLGYFKGYLLYQKKSYDVAASFLENSIKIQPNWTPSLMLLGEVYNRLDRSQEAYNIFGRVLKISPSHPEALFQRAVLNIERFSKNKTGLKYFNAGIKSSKVNKTDKSIQSRASSIVAKLYLRSGENSKAEDLARIAFDLDPSNISAKNILISTGATADASSADKFIIAEADTLYDAGEWKAATAIYEQAYSINSKNGYAALRLANCYWNQSFVSDAIKWAELSVAADPRRIESYVTLSEFLINQFRLVDAARVLMKARAINKTSFEVYRGFAKIELIRKNYQGAIRYAKKALKIYSNDVESIIISIKALKELGELEKAYAHSRAAMEVSRSSFELENIYAELVMKTQGLAVAEEYIEERMNVSAGDFRYQIILANMYFEDQQYRKSAQISLRANELLEWESWEGAISYARAMGALGKLEAAIDQYEKAYLMKPTHASPLFESGLMLVKNLKPKKAIKQFERVERANPLYPDLLYQWATALKMLSEKERKPELAQEAIQFAKKELARDPSHFEAYLLIAETYYVLGSISKSATENTSANSPDYSEKYDEMVSWYKLCAKNYQKAIDKAVQPGEVYIDMARCQRLSGALDQARASAVMAESLDKTNPRIWFETAQIYEQQGGRREALKAYENFLLIYPNAPNKKEVEKKINKLKSITEEN